MALAAKNLFFLRDEARVRATLCLCSFWKTDEALERLLSGLRVRRNLSCVFLL